jgi:hypothetical protein
MIFDPHNPYDVREARRLLDEFLNGKSLFEIKRKASLRSLKQNSYLHLILGYFASEYGCSTEQAKVDFFKRTCNKELFEREKVNRHGKIVRYLRSSAELDSKEMTDAIERFRNWSAAVAEIYLPAPNEEQFLRHCMKMIEENREFV